MPHGRVIGAIFGLAWAAHAAAQVPLTGAGSGGSLGPPPVTLVTPMIFAESGTISPTVVDYAGPFSSTSSSNIATGTGGPQVPWPIAGKFTNLYVNLAGITAGSYTVGINDNGTLSALQCVAATGATSCTDSTDNLSVAAGDNITIEFCPRGLSLADCNTAGGGPTITAGAQVVVSALFTSTYNQESFLVGGSPNNASNSAAQYNGFGGIQAWGTTENLMSSLIPVAGTIDNLRVNISGTPGGVAYYASVVYHNGLATSLAAGDATHCGGSSTSCSDTAGCTVGATTCTHGFSVAAGDTISVQQTPNGTPTARAVKFSVRFTPTTTGQSILSSNFTSVPVGTTGVTRYSPANGTTAYSATETAEENIAPVLGTTMTFSKLIAAESTAPTNPNHRDATLFDSGANGALGTPLTTAVTQSITSASTLTIGGVAGTPAAQDTTHSVTSASGHLFDYHIVNTGVQNAVTWYKSAVAVTVP